MFGKPSSPLIFGQLNGVDCVLLSRHDKSHRTGPTQVNYRANLLALRDAGCHIVLATTACGSLNESYKPGDLAILDDFIDRTSKRESTYYDGTQPAHFDKICHIPMYPAYCDQIRQVLIDECQKAGISFHSHGTMVSIEGPRFSSRAESRMFQQWGAHTINMTTCPEVQLAKELALPYASIGIVTDYDCWRDHHDAEHVDVESVLKTFKASLSKVTGVLINSVASLTKVDWPPVLESYKKTVASSLL